MKKIWIITKRELGAYFDSDYYIAYIMIICFLGFTGFFTWLGGTSNIFFGEQVSLQVFFEISRWTLFFIIPALTMGLIAEEKKTGTLELLLTKPATDWEVVMGKFLAPFLLVLVILLLTLPYYYTISTLGKVDHSSVIFGYFGLILMSATYISIGIFASSITNNQIVAFMGSLFIGIFFQFLFGFFTIGTTSAITKFFDYLSLESHYQSIIRGVFDSKDFIYFLSIIFLGLVSAESMLAKRNLLD
jgi:ABC-2 type transport system permease protein